MKYAITTENPLEHTTPCLILAVFENGELSTITKEIDSRSTHYLSKIIEQGDITGKLGQTLMLYQVPHITAQRVLLIGCGKYSEFSEKSFRKAIASAANSIGEANIAAAT